MNKRETAISTTALSDPIIIYFVNNYFTSNYSIIGMERSSVF